MIKQIFTVLKSIAIGRDKLDKEWNKMGIPYKVSLSKTLMEIALSGSNYDIPERRLPLRIHLSVKSAREILAEHVLRLESHSIVQR